MTTIHVSSHAYKRIKKRFGLGKKAARRYAEKAFYDGVFPKDYWNKDVARWYNAKQQEDFNQMILIYKDRVFIYGLSDKNPMLITVYDIYDDAPARKHEYNRGVLVYKNEDVKTFKLRS